MYRQVDSEFPWVYVLLDNFGSKNEMIDHSVVAVVTEGYDDIVATLPEHLTFYKNTLNPWPKVSYI